MLVKEFKKFGRIKCEYGGSVVISTLILTTGQVGSEDKTFGIKFEQRDGDAQEESCLLDYDEIKEFLLAIKCLFETATEMREADREYTECIYCTKDDMRIGFYQNANDREQSVFFSVSAYAGSQFISFDQLREIFNVVKEAREYLRKCGAGSADRQGGDAGTLIE